MPKTMQKTPRIDYDSVTISKNALGIWYESCTIFRIGEFVAKDLNSSKLLHMGQYPLLSVLSARLSFLNIDHSRNLPVEIRGINHTEKYTNL